HLCNRSLQEQALISNLWTRSSGQKRPHLLVIHGPRGEAHEGFVERLEKDLLPRLFNNENRPTRTISPLEWPIYFKKGATPREIFEPMLAKSLDVHPFAGLAYLAESLAVMEGMTLLTLTVDTEAWGQEGDIIFRSLL